MTYKQLFYFTGHCLALDEHPEFREQIIELFADDALSLSKDATRNPSVPERVLPEQPRVLGGSKEAVEGNIQNSTFNIQNFIQLCSDHLIIPANYFTIFNKLYAYLSRQLLLQPSI